MPLSPSDGPPRWGGGPFCRTAEPLCACVCGGGVAPLSLPQVGGAVFRLFRDFVLRLFVCLLLFLSLLFLFLPPFSFSLYGALDPLVGCHRWYFSRSLLGEYSCRRPVFAFFVAPV